LLPLTFGPFWGWSSWSVVASLLVAGSTLVLLGLHERPSARPLVAPELYRGNRMFAVACASALLTYAAVYGVGLLTAVYLQVVQGLSASAAGAILLVQPVMMACLAPLAGRLYDRVGSRGLTTAGSLVMALGTLVLGATAPQGSWPEAMVGLALIGLGLALFSTPNISAILGSVAPDRLSLASAVLGTNRFVGQALSVALLGAIAAAQLSGPAGVSLTAQIAATGEAATFVAGYRWALVVGAGIAAAAAAAAAAAMVSANRGRPGLPGDTQGD
jgi:MFS family permease